MHVGSRATRESHPYLHGSIRTRDGDESGFRARGQAPLLAWSDSRDGEFRYCRGDTAVSFAYDSFGRYSLLDEPLTVPHE